MFPTLLIDNGSIRIEELKRLLGPAVTTILPAELPQIRERDFTLIVLSGSSQFPVIGNADRYAAEIELIRSATTPIIGICLGCELIVTALGGTLRDLGEKRTGLTTIRPVPNPDAMFDPGYSFQVYEAHRWAVDRLPPGFSVIATSEHGPEIIRHRERPLVGIQFHPEHLTDTTMGDELFGALLRQLNRTD